MSSRQFIATIKGIKVAGDYPDIELAVTISMPLRSAEDVSFLAGVKQHGQAVIDIQSAQPELPLMDGPDYEQKARAFAEKYQAHVDEGAEAPTIEIKV